MSTELARRAASGDRAPEVLAWLAAGLRRHLDGDDLEHSLGLDRASRLRERNRALKEAADHLAADTPWRTACRLAAAIRRYEARIRPHIERRHSTPLAPAEEAIRRAFDTGQRVPSTARNLFELIR
jgi:hypothetical protein